MREELARQIKEAGGQRAWAKKHYVTSSVPFRVLSERMPVSDRIAAEMGYSPRTGWERIDGEPPILTTKEMKAELARQCVIFGGKQSWSKVHNLCHSTAAQVFAGRLGFSERVAECMGYRRVAGWELIQRRKISVYL